MFEPSVTLAVQGLIDQLSNPDATTRAKAALAVRLANQLDLPEEGKGIAAVARELRFLIQDLAGSEQQDQASRLDRVLGHMAKTN
jgi:hypothetical protein